MGLGIIGGWASLADSLVVEALGRVGFDFVGLDLQHGEFGQRDAAHALQILALLGTPSLVRLSSEELPLIPHLLDYGADEVMVATVDDPATLARAIALTRYQPVGIRSDGGSRFGLGPPLDPSVRARVWAMIETRPGLAAVEAIAAVDGLHGIAVGPGDLARALGVPYAERMADPGWRAAVDRVLSVGRERDLAVAMFVPDGDQARQWLEAGFSHIVLSNDLDLLRRASRSELAAARA